MPRGFFSKTDGTSVSKLHNLRFLYVTWKEGGHSQVMFVVCSLYEQIQRRGILEWTVRSLLVSQGHSQLKASSQTPFCALLEPPWVLCNVSLLAYSVIAFLFLFSSLCFCPCSTLSAPCKVSHLLWPFSWLHLGCSTAGSKWINFPNYS